MKYFNLGILSLVFFCLLSCKKEQKTQALNNLPKTTHYYFIRHAEKDTSDDSNHNPHLTLIGKQRAKKWSLLFGDVAFNAVYSTNYHRTKETATPAALKNNLKLTMYNPNNFQLSNFLSDTEGKNILIVGHSNTTPKLVNDIIKASNYETISENTYDIWFKVSIIDGKISHQKNIMPSL